MPPDLTAIHNQLFQEVAWLHMLWIEFKKLFETEEHRKLLNLLPAFFSNYQFILVDSMLLSISRLTDKEKTGKHENLCLERLANHVDLNTAPDLQLDLRKKLENLRVLTEHIREHRDKRIAHRDRELVQNAQVQPLPAITHKNIEDALSIIRDIMDAVESHFQSVETAYEHPIVGPGDTNDLFFYLNTAYDFLEQEMSKDHE